MKCACSLTPVLAIVGLVGLGLAGYNTVRTGCPLGGCGETSTPAATGTTIVNARAGGTCHASDGGSACHQGQGQVMSASQTGACPAAGHCPMASESACGACPAAGDCGLRARHEVETAELPPAAVNGAY